MSNYFIEVITIHVNAIDLILRKQSEMSEQEIIVHKRNM